MPPDVAPDVSTASASTESSPVLTIPADEASYSEWRLTGKLPEKKSPEKPSKPEESAAPEPSAEGPEHGSDAPEEKTAPAPEAGEEPTQERRQPPQKAPAGPRLQEILNDLRAAGLTPSMLKNFKYQQQQVQPSAPEKTAQPPAPQQPAELKEPLLQDFPTIEGWAKAMREYNQHVARLEVQEGIRQYALQQQQAQINAAAAQRLAEAKRVYGEEAEPAIVSAAQSLFNDQAIHPAIKGLVNDSPAMTHVLYVMGSNQAEFNDFLSTAKSNPGEAIRRLVTLENLVMEELRKQSPSNGQVPERGEDGKFISSKPPARKPSEAPPPAREVSGRGAPPPDEVSAAFQRNDFNAFRNAANRRDLAKFKGR